MVGIYCGYCCRIAWIYVYSFIRFNWRNQQKTTPWWTSSKIVNDGNGKRGNNSSTVVIVAIDKGQ